MKLVKTKLNRGAFLVLLFAFLFTIGQQGVALAASPGEVVTDRNAVSNVTGVELGSDGTGILVERKHTLNQKTTVPTSLAKLKEIRGIAWDQDLPLDGKTVQEVARIYGYTTKEDYVNAVYMSGTAERVAIQRAVETVTHGQYTHSRTSGRPIYTARYPGGASNSGEVLGWTGSIERAFKMWGVDEIDDLIATDGHFSTANGHLHILIHPSYVAYGFADIGGMQVGIADWKKYDDLSTGQDFNGEYTLQVVVKQDQYREKTSTSEEVVKPEADIVKTDDTISKDESYYEVQPKDGLKQITTKEIYAFNKIVTSQVDESIISHPVQGVYIQGNKPEEKPEEVKMGWYKQDGYWRYRKANGEDARSEWLWLEIGNTGRYNFKFFSFEGKSVNLFFEHPDGRLWLSQEGPLTEYKIGWWTDPMNGQTYYFRDSGSMVHGWQYIDGDWYFFRPTGTMVRSAWVWTKTLKTGEYNFKYFSYEGKSVNLFFEQPDGRIWLSLAGPYESYYRGFWTDPMNGMSYYFRETSGSRVEGWQWIDGGWKFFLKNSGTQAFGWIWVNGYWYYMDPVTGNMVTGSRIINNVFYRFNSSGRLIGNRIY